MRAGFIFLFCAFAVLPSLAAELDSCFIVRAKGDTLYGVVEHRLDHSTLQGNSVKWNTIVFRRADGKVVSFIPNQIKELFILNAPEGFQRYLVFNDEYYASTNGILYRVLVDG